VATFHNANSGRPDASAAVYIDGQRRGWMQGYEHNLTWNIQDLTIGLGQRYSGAIDEFLILDQTLDADQIQQLYQLPGPASDLL